MNIMKEQDMKIPIKMWLNDIEDGAVEQAINLSKLPFAFHHIALMPDCHQGYGMPIGGVLATEGAVIPNAVGVDIGCGMCAVRTNITEINTDILKRILGKIRETVPVGFNHHKDFRAWDGFGTAPDIEVIQRELRSAQHQIGTLGGGNHFIEIQKGNNGFIWIMLHSGSRNFGLKIAKEYHEKAKSLCDKWYSQLPNPDLSFLPQDSVEGKEYIVAMQYALDFAKASRFSMLEVIAYIFENETGKKIDSDIINIHHNYASLENHFGKNVWVHRKGATLAREGTTGIIPGSQGTKSYIVSGKGNQESFMSCSHGAGRAMGRKQAQRELNLKEEQNRLDKQGIIHSVRNEKDLDEAAGAYKNIDVVMENQHDLVKVEVELSPLAVIKG